MSKSERIPKLEISKHSALALLGIGASFAIRHSSFVIPKA